MPLFVDTHKGTDLPQELRTLVETRVRTGDKDKFGVIDRGVIIDRDGGHMMCVLDAPNAKAVKDHHASLGVPLEESTIHRADAILRS